ncbi:MAG: Asp-tRNA(Asn)/Glu-tRNA(Gln) amidotransferase GatCAB subunit B, partial [Planctomycetaceae bacterium]|nr:Asp-tRNA(Asn)/Glu-tRNA(Gln) amidotransferase GatCAB subunit B [Planctomycetaceae bacterium]
AEAKAYLEELKLLLSYIGVSDCNMQEGSLRCDANINLHVMQDGEKIPTPIVEVKNVNSFRNVELACEYEVVRQFEQFKETGKRLGEVEKETRGWDANRGVTFSQRGKEEASDYRYFPDPDLVPVIVSDEMLNEAKANLCEFPAVRRQRFIDEYKLSTYDATVIIEKLIPFADYFETVAKGCGDGKQAANWVTQDVTREMNDRGLSIEEFPIKADVLAALLSKVLKGDLTIKSAREVFMDLIELPVAECTTARIDQIIDEKGLGALQDTGQIAEVISAVVARNEKAASDIREGKLQAAGPMIGQVMKELKGADPKTVRQMIIDHIQGN